MTKVVWLLVGGEADGEYEAESTWPPPERIRAVYGGGLLGDGPPAVLDLPDDLPDPGERVVEYQLSSYGFACGRRAKNWNPMQALYMPVGLAYPARQKALLRTLRPDLHVVS